LVLSAGRHDHPVRHRVRWPTAIPLGLSATTYKRIKRAVADGARRQTLPSAVAGRTVGHLRRSDSPKTPPRNPCIPAAQAASNVLPVAPLWVLALRARYRAASERGPRCHVDGIASCE
jgi:hypothetical protein